ncbi:MAG: hypothetical protein V4494_04485 [Chlamydiota bacterium]
MSIINNNVELKAPYNQLEEKRAFVIKELIIFKTFFENKTANLEDTRVDWYSKELRNESIVEFKEFIDQLITELELENTDELLQKKISSFSTFLKTNHVAFNILSDSLFISTNWEETLYAEFENKETLESSRFLKKFSKAYYAHEDIRSYLVQYNESTLDNQMSTLKEMFREDTITELASLIDKGYLAAFLSLEKSQFIFKIVYGWNFELENKLSLLDKVVETVENKEKLKNYPTLQSLEKVVNLETFQIRAKLPKEKQWDSSIIIDSPLLKRSENLSREIIHKRAQSRTVPQISISGMTSEALEESRMFVLRDFDFFNNTEQLQKDSTVRHYYGKHSQVFSHQDIPKWIFKIMKKEEADSSKQALDQAMAILKESPYQFCHIPEGLIAGDLRDGHALMMMERAEGISNIEEAQKATKHEFELIPSDSAMAEKWQAMTREGAEVIAKLGYWDVGFHNMLWDSKKGWSFIDFEQVEPNPEHIKEGLERFIKMVPYQFINEIYQVAADHGVTLS